MDSKMILVVLAFALSVASLVIPFAKSGTIVDHKDKKGCLGAGNDNCDAKGKTVQAFAIMAAIFGGLCVLMMYFQENASKFIPLIDKLGIEISCCAAIGLAMLCSFIGFFVAVGDVRSEGEDKEWEAGFYTLLFSIVAYFLAFCSSSCQMGEISDVLSMIVKSPKKKVDAILF